MELLERYMKEVSDDLKVDRINITEFSMKVPSTKHFWVGRLMTHQKELMNLKKKKIQLTKELAKNISTPIILSRINATKEAEQSDIVQQVNDKINELEIIVEYLEKVEKTMSNLTYDVKNVIAAHQMEMM